MMWLCKKRNGSGKEVMKKVLAIRLSGKYKEK
jgi:hypothetical protein